MKRERMGKKAFLNILLRLRFFFFLRKQANKIEIVRQRRKRDFTLRYN